MDRIRNRPAILPRISFLLLCAVLLVLAQACAHTAAGPRRTNAELTLVSFGSVNGELAPCG